MPNTFELQTAPAESVPIPPEAAIIALPLTEVVVLDLGQAEAVAATPEKRVDLFFEANREIMESVDEAWVAVKVAQGALKSAVLTYHQQNQSPGRHSRDTRRENIKRIQAFATPHKVFGEAKYQGFTLLPQILHEIKRGGQAEASNNDIVMALKQYYDHAIEEIHQDESLQDLPKSLQDFVIQMTENRETLVVANAYARYRQKIALDAVLHFLKDDSIVPAFMQRLVGLAQTNEQQRDYPGIVELLATHMKHKDRDNALQEAVFRTAPHPHTYAQEFIREIGKGRQLPKELSAALGTMELAAQIVQSEFSMERTDFLALFANRVTDWPPELQARLEAFAASKVTDTWGSIKESLLPFVREGRLPVEVIQKTHAPSTKRKKESGSPKQSDKNAAQKFTFVTGAQDMENLIGNTEKEPIAHFVVLESKGDKAGRGFRLHEVDAIEDILELTNIREYIEKHSTDKSLEPIILTALKHLTKEPKDPAHTKQYKGVYYDPEGLAGDRRPRRFSPQHFVVSGVAKGSIIPKTRLIYDVFNYKGKPTLAVYGAFIKADIEQINNILPRP